MEKFPKLLLAVFGILFFTSAAQALDPAMVGNIKTVSGSVFVLRSDGSRAAQPGFPLFQGDKIRTDASGRVGLIFRDDTRLSLGAGSILVIEEFLFSPGINQLSMILSLQRGTVAYFPGELAKLDPEAVLIKTPVATVGVKNARCLMRIEE